MRRLPAHISVLWIRKEVNVTSQLFEILEADIKFMNDVTNDGYKFRKIQYDVNIILSESLTAGKVC